jgi:hypothetical protein
LDLVAPHTELLTIEQDDERGMDAAWEGRVDYVRP